MLVTLFTLLFANYNPLEGQDLWTGDFWVSSDLILALGYSFWAWCGCSIPECTKHALRFRIQKQRWSFRTAEVLARLFAQIEIP